VPPYRFDDDIVELEQEDELNQSVENSTSDTRCNQIFACSDDFSLQERPAFKKGYNLSDKKILTKLNLT